MLTRNLHIPAPLERKRREQRKVLPGTMGRNQCVDWMVIYYYYHFIDEETVLEESDYLSEVIEPVCWSYLSEKKRLSYLYEFDIPNLLWDEITTFEYDWLKCVIPTIYSFLFSLPTHHISTPLGYQPGLSRYKLMPHTLLEDIWLPIMEVSFTTRVPLLSWSPALPLMSCLFFSCRLPTEVSSMPSAFYPSWRPTPSTLFSIITPCLASAKWN